MVRYARQLTHGGAVASPKVHVITDEGTLLCNSTVSAAQGWMRVDDEGTDLCANCGRKLAKTTKEA